jgi:hypothetical protein
MPARAVPAAAACSERPLQRHRIGMGTASALSPSPAPGRGDAPTSVMCLSPAHHQLTRDLLPTCPPAPPLTFSPNHLFRSFQPCRPFSARPTTRSTPSLSLGRWQSLPTSTPSRCSTRPGSEAPTRSVAACPLAWHPVWRLTRLRTWLDPISPAVGQCEAAPGGRRHLAQEDAYRQRGQVPPGRVGPAERLWCDLLASLPRRLSAGCQRALTN